MRGITQDGYGGPEVKMQQLKMRVRAIINAILDQSIHAGRMNEQEALDLMMKEGFQQEGEAVAKWKRARSGPPGDPASAAANASGASPSSTPSASGKQTFLATRWGAGSGLSWVTGLRVSW